MARSRLTFLRDLGPRLCSDGRNRKYAEYQCSCGNIHVTQESLARREMILSCGCLQVERSIEALTRSNKARGLPPGEASFNSLFGAYKVGAVERNLIWQLTKKEFRTLTEQDCVYCGAAPSQIYKANECNGVYVYSGVDRRDNSKGYTIENCQSCCKTCNYWKKDLKEEDFIAHARKISNRFPDVL